MKNIGRKIGIILMTLMLVLLQSSVVFATGPDLPDHIIYPDSDETRWRFYEYDAEGYESGTETIEVNGFEIHRQCSRLAGKDSRLCGVEIVGTDACREAEIVCNIKNVGANMKDDWEDPVSPCPGVPPYCGTGPGNRLMYLGVVEMDEPSSSASSAAQKLVRQEEKAEYCDLDANFCPGHETGGNSDYAVQQDVLAWDALQSGDISGFICHSMAADTEGFFGCGEESVDPTFVMPIEETTFTGYDGVFEAPDADGYAEGLTQNTGIREYILNVTNFALGFLGLIAVLAVIYGGFIYLTAGGDSGKTEKGRNSILYAVIGIIIILASYALVYTVICFAPVGGDRNPTYCRLGGSSSITAPSTGALANEIGAPVKTTFDNAKNRMKDIADGVIMASTAHKNVYSASEHLMNLPYEFNEGIDQGLRTIALLRGSVGEFVYTTGLLAEMEDYLSSEHAIAQASWDVMKLLNLPVAHASPFNRPSPGNKAAPELGLTSEDIEGLFVFEVMEIYAGQLKEAADEDYDLHLIKYKNYAQALVDLFEEIDDAKTEMQHVKDVLDNLAQDNLRGDQELILDLIEEGNEALEIIENLQFVEVKLNASTDRCTAPCTVLFDSIGTIDPSGRTVLDGSHEWDLDGDGAFNVGGTYCEEKNEATVSCFYDKPGTYVVTLKVNSEEPAVYASGIAVGVIEVTRPLAQIKITVASGSGQNAVGPFTAVDNTGDFPIRNGKLKFTVEQARNLIFNATGSKGSSGRDIEQFTWSMGGDTFQGDSAIQDYSYTQEGNYRVILEVTEDGRTEREVVFLQIGSPAANFLILNQTEEFFQTGQTLEFDGGLSQSDNGSITSYTWTVYREGEEAPVEAQESNDPEFSFTPTQPGLYRVSLQVLDSKGEVDVTDNTFMVESQAPQACFTYEFPDNSQPGTAQFRNCSFDPDGDDLKFVWEVENGEFAEGYDFDSEEPMIKFDEIGENKVTLTVNDKYISDDFRKEDTVEEMVQVDSILDVALEFPNGSAYQLDETTGQAEVTFNILSENAEDVEMFFGYDEERQQKDHLTDVTEFTHTYTEAGVYNVEATVYDSASSGAENSVSQRIFVGESNSPLAVLDILLNGVSLQEEGGSIELPKGSSVTFNGAQSLNKDGTARNLSYLINFGDGDISSNETANHIYSDVGDYEAVFTVTDENSGVSDSVSLIVSVVDMSPVIHSMSSNILSSSLETPVDIQVRVDASDADGEIMQYVWKMFDYEDESNVLATLVTQRSQDQVEFRYHGLGTTGEEHTIGFCVTVRDEGGNETTSCDGNGAQTFILAVTGENEPPFAKFSVQPGTNVEVGMPVIFHDESTDDQNEIVKVWYDVEGNGFQDDEEMTVHSYEYEYERKNESGYPVRIKVEDSNGATAVSQPILIYVDSSVGEPEARFDYEVDYLTVEFEDTSILEAELGMRRWDFNLDEDSDGNGNPGDDEDSTSADPQFTYNVDGSYRVGLQVWDEQGNVDSVEQTIELVSESLEARMETIPAPAQGGMYNGKILLSGDSGSVTIDVSPSEGNIDRYVIDGNARYSSTGDPSLAGEDEDHVFGPEGGQVTIEYRREWQPIEIKLTIYDPLGNSDYITRSVVFEEEEPAVTP